uniref:Inositol hexakisphosphate and diphosphoinositol-pentakisphosphate kinase n=3 Tax=Acrobeloides nanus TaxID=290746 RepID=A0A914BWE0_9BILA
MASNSRPSNDGGETSGIKKIIIGICAMQRKANSKPMKAIMAKIMEYYSDWLEFVIFPEDVILNEPVENWPLCDCLISFYATDFPLHKAIQYEKLRRPYVINDLNRQYDLLDRRKVFHNLARAGIDHPRHCVLIRDAEGRVEGELKEFNDHIEVNGGQFHKPFVEKPISAEDHSIYIYYPSSVGGGSQHLFRKINDRSSRYSPVSTVRKEGSYLYEEFIPADGTDIKVYAVGPYYAHAEARKAPGLDGKVERDADGKEVRYPVILSAKEKMIARRVVLAFGQTVCGFDLLRANGRSYVCDVNGFSFVKTSTKYYEDTAKILGNTILRRLASSMSIPWHIPYQDDDPPLVSTPSGKIMELRCVIAVIRHGDRTPKQKMKVIVNDERFFRLFRKYDGMKKKEIKMKRPNQLMEVLELIREILHEQQDLRDNLLHHLAEVDDDSDESRQVEHDLEKCEENVKTWDQMRCVLEMWGGKRFSQSEYRINVNFQILSLKYDFF